MAARNGMNLEPSISTEKSPEQPPISSIEAALTMSQSLSLNISQFVDLNQPTLWSKP